MIAKELSVVTCSMSAENRIFSSCNFNQGIPSG